MTARKVAEILTSMGIRAEMNGHGFPLRRIEEFYGLQEFRLECGSGIAGHSGHWRLVQVGSGESSPAYKTESALRRCLREWLAGPKPHFPGKWYAKMHRNRFGEAYIWVKREKGEDR